MAKIIKLNEKIVKLNADSGVSIEELEKGRLVITSKLFRPEYTLIDRSFPLDTALW